MEDEYEHNITDRFAHICGNIMHFGTANEEHIP